MMIDAGFFLERHTRAMRIRVQPVVDEGGDEAPPSKSSGVTFGFEDRRRRLW
jgi:hypothetical protein